METGAAGPRPYRQLLGPDLRRRPWIVGRPRAHGVYRITSPFHAADGLDVHQLNITYFSALDEDDERYLAARAIQLFAPGIPQLYYVGLMAGVNDLEAVRSSGEGRAINRRNLGAEDITAAMDRPMVRRLMELVRLRNTHLAFEGEMSVDDDDGVMTITWRRGDSACELVVDAQRGTARVRATDTGAIGERWQAV